MNYERLQIMATILDEAAVGTWKPTQIPMAPDASYAKTWWEDILAEPVKFHMCTWGNETPEGADHGEYRCGYTACAIGHAILDNRLPGLTSFNDDSELVPEYRGECQWDAVMSFFGITQEQANHLFSEEAYYPEDFEVDDPDFTARPNEVAVRIRELMSEGTSDV